MTFAAWNFAVLLTVGAFWIIFLIYSTIEQHQKRLNQYEELKKEEESNLKKSREHYIDNDVKKKVLTNRIQIFKLKSFNLDMGTAFQFIFDEWKEDGLFSPIKVIMKKGCLTFSKLWNPNHDMWCANHKPLFAIKLGKNSDTFLMYVRGKEDYYYDTDLNIFLFKLFGKEERNR